MQDYTKSLGSAVKQARDNLGYTQARVAELADIDVRTVLNIENLKGNPKFEVLYPKIMNRKQGMMSPALFVMCFIIRSRNKKVPERRSFRHCVNSVTVIALLQH